MSTTLNFKDKIDLPEWRPVSPFQAGSATAGALTMYSDFAQDYRGRNYAHPEMLTLQATSSLYAYNFPNDSWYMKLVAPAQAGTFGAGMCSMFVPTQGFKGQIASGNSTSKICLPGLSNTPIAPLPDTAPLSWTRSATTATVTHTSHGFSTGQIVRVSVSSDQAAIAMGNFTITVVDANTYTFTCTNAGNTVGTLKIMAMVKVSWARSSATATITHTSHGLSVGQTLTVQTTSDASAIVLGNVTIASVTDANTYTFTCLNAGGASGTATLVIPTMQQAVLTTPTWTRSTTTATVTHTAHGLVAGQSITITQSSDTSAIATGSKTIASIVDANTYTFACTNAGASSGTVSVQFATATKWTRVTTTATVVTATPHGLLDQAKIAVVQTSDQTAVAVQLAQSNPVSITVVSATSFTFTCNNVGATSGTFAYVISTLETGGSISLLGVHANQLANRGDGLGYIIRIIGNSYGGSGKIEERRIVSNTRTINTSNSGYDNVLVYLDQPLSFTPQAGDTYELLSGRVYFLTTGVSTAGSCRYYDVATRTFSGNIAATGQTVGTVGNALVPLDEQHVPYSRNPGEGFVVDTTVSGYDVANTENYGVGYYSKRCLVATASALGSITGQATNGDVNVLANEYRNFQIRIVGDTGNPTSVGQRRRISGHTAGPSAVYSLYSNWSQIPSSTAQFVIENDNDKMICIMAGIASPVTYNHSTNVWDTTTFAARVVSGNTGCAFQFFGIDVAGNYATLDPMKGIRNSQIISLRGNSSTIYDTLDIAGSPTGAWDIGQVINNVSTGQFFAGAGSSSYDYMPNANQGRYIYYSENLSASVNAPTPVRRIDIYSKSIEPYSTLKIAAGALANAGSRMTQTLFIDGTTVVPMLYMPRSGGNVELYQLIITR